MATLLGSLLVSLGLESGEFKSGLTAAETQMRKSAKRIEKIGNDMARTGRNLSIAVTAPLAALGVTSFKAASDAAELESAFNQTFGNMAKDMRNWAQVTGDAMGRSTQEMQNAANTFGIFFNQAAPTKQAAADMAKQFAVLAQDLSSFYNTSPEEALAKLRSGLTGESEPLRDFGVFLDEATVKNKALAMGLARTSAELTEQDKILARANIIMEETKNAQGDVARTADGTANKVRAAKAAFEELQVAIGQKLLPALTPLIDALARALNAFNRLPEGVQTTVVVVGALVAAMGPLLFIIGNVTRLIAPFIASLNAMQGALALAGIQASRTTLAIGSLKLAVANFVVAAAPWLAVLGAVSLAYYALTKRQEDLTTASKAATDAVRASEKANEAAADAAQKLAVATGKAREEALRQARAERMAVGEKLRSARASLVLAKAELARARARESVINQTGSIGDTSGLLFGSDQVTKASTEVKARQAAYDNFAKSFESLTKAINSAAAPVSVTAVGGGGSSTTGGGGSSSTRSGPTGPSAADIQRRFEDEMIGYTQQSLGAMQQIATSAEERAELEMRSVEWARKQTLAQIAADEDYNAAQKAQLSGAVERLAEYERMGIEFRQMQELERERNDMLQVAFDRDRELLALQGDVADTQSERKAIAMDILRIEQEYRRNQLEMLVASETTSDAEKRRAQAILDSLAAIEAGETAAASRANETDAEKYMRGLNKSPGQISEELDRIKINGLENLNDALTDAIVNFKSLKDVAHNVIKSILADLLRLQIQQAIIKPLAQAMGLGVPGFAMGTNFAPGGLAIVGERGPELVNLPRGSQVIPNDRLAGLGGGGPQINITVNGAMSDEAARRTGTQIGASAARQYALARRTGLAG